jgi:hypothetical protein
MAAAAVTALALALVALASAARVPDRRGQALRSRFVSLRAHVGAPRSPYPDAAPPAQLWLLAEAGLPDPALAVTAQTLQGRLAQQNASAQLYRRPAADSVAWTWASPTDMAGGGVRVGAVGWQLWLEDLRAQYGIDVHEELADNFTALAARLLPGASVNVRCDAQAVRVR